MRNKTGGVPPPVELTVSGEQTNDYHSEVCGPGLGPNLCVIGLRQASAAVERSVSKLLEQSDQIILCLLSIEKKKKESGCCCVFYLIFSINPFSSHFIKV